MKIPQQQKGFLLLREKPLQLNRIQYTGAYIFMKMGKSIMPFEGESLRESRHF